MIRLIACICVLTVGLCCVLAMSNPLEVIQQGRIVCQHGRLLAGSMGSPAKLSAKPVHKDDLLTVFLTGNELGTLQPCGCSGGQLGGLDRRSAVFASVPLSKRLIVDTGSFIEGDGEQDIIKFNIIIQAFSLLGYDLVNLTEKDIEISRNLGLLDSISSMFNVISSHSSLDVNVPAKFTKQLSLKGKIVAVTVAALDTESESMNSIVRLFPLATRPGLRSVNILILNSRDTVAIEKITKMGIVDCFIVPAESDEPEIISDHDEKPLVLSVGRLGKYVGRLQVKTEQGGGKLTLSFSAVSVTEDLPQEKSLIELYKDYQQLVKEANFLEKLPRFSLPRGLEYTGSKSCRPCHEYEYEKWRTKAHAKAFSTLEKVGSQYDPECVLCHVVGMEKVSGFVSEEKTGHLKNVGCENCHGPGAEHIKTQGMVRTSEPKSNCADCHTPEHSNYAGSEQLYLEKIIHWREPNAVDDVKEKGESKK